MHPECITKKSQTQHTGLLGATQTLWGKDITLFGVPGRRFPAKRSLTSQVTLLKKKRKKRQIKNSFVECLVTFTVYHCFLPWFWVVYMRNVSETNMYCKLCNVCKVSLILRVYIHGSRNVFKVI